MAQFTAPAEVLDEVLAPKKRQRKSKWTLCIDGKLRMYKETTHFEKGKARNLLMAATQWGRNQTPKLRIVYELVYRENEGQPMTGDENIVGVKLQFKPSAVQTETPAPQQETQEETKEVVS